jgi:hypothetical protein
MTTPPTSQRTLEEELGLQATKVELGLLDEPQPIPIGRDERFLVHRSLGRGSMGVVYLADDLRLKREVALKVVAPRRLEHGQLEQRLQREAQALAALRHENVVHDEREGQRRVLVSDFGLAGPEPDTHEARPPARAKGADLHFAGCRRRARAYGLVLLD